MKMEKLLLKSQNFSRMKTRKTLKLTQKILLKSKMRRRKMLRLRKMRSMTHS